MDNEELELDFSEEDELQLDFEDEEELQLELNEDPKGMTEKNYENLINKPKINNIELLGNKTLNDLGIQEKGSYAEKRITNTELEEIFKDW